MDPLSVIYATKVVLGVLTAVLCLLLGVDSIITGVSVGLIVYLVSDRILKQIFIEKVKNLSTVTKTGIGIYIIMWFFLWILIYTLLNPNPIQP